MLPLIFTVCSFKSNIAIQFQTMGLFSPLKGEPCYDMKMEMALLHTKQIQAWTIHDDDDDDNSFSLATI